MLPCFFFRLYFYTNFVNPLNVFGEVTLSYASAEAQIWR